MLRPVHAENLGHSRIFQLRNQCYNIQKSAQMLTYKTVIPSLSVIYLSNICDTIYQSPYVLHRPNDLFDLPKRHPFDLGCHGWKLREEVEELPVTWQFTHIDMQWETELIVEIAEVACAPSGSELPLLSESFWNIRRLSTFVNCPSLLVIVAYVPKKGYSFMGYIYMVAVTHHFREILSLPAKVFSEIQPQAWPSHLRSCRSYRSRSPLPLPVLTIEYAKATSGSNLNANKHLVDLKYLKQISRDLLPNKIQYSIV